MDCNPENRIKIIKTKRGFLKIDFKNNTFCITCKGTV